MISEPLPRSGLAGVVLCGGRSSRMGGEKALLPVGGEPLVLRVAARVSGVAAPVLLAPGTPGRLGPLPFPEIPDERPGVGPLGGVVAALRASPHPLLAVVAVDMPLASGPVLRLLAGRCAGHEAVLPVDARGPQPLHAVYARSALPALRAALDAGTLSMRRALATLRVRLVPEAEWRAADPTGRFATNLNDPGDLRLVDLGERARSPYSRGRTEFEGGPS